MFYISAPKWWETWGIWITASWLCNLGKWLDLPKPVSLICKMGTIMVVVKITLQNVWQSELLINVFCFVSFKKIGVPDIYIHFRRWSSYWRFMKTHRNTTLSRGRTSWFSSKGDTTTYCHWSNGKQHWPAERGLLCLGSSSARKVAGNTIKSVSLYSSHSSYAWDVFPGVPDWPRYFMV